MGLSKFHKYSWEKLTHNGWKWEQKRSVDIDDYEVFSLTILVMYEVKVYACISTVPKHLDLDGHYGVMWLEAEYEYDRPHEISELKEMISGMALAESNLLLIGIPFSPGYKFIDNVDVKTTLNEKLRKELDLEKQEDEEVNADGDID